MVFQRRRKQLRQKGASTLLADFPNKENKRQDQGKKKRGDNGKDGQRKGARIATGFGSGAPSHGSKPPPKRAVAALVARFAGRRRRRRDPRRLEPRARPNRRKTARDHPPIRLKQRQAAANLQQPSARPAPTPKRGKARGKEWARRLRVSQKGNQMKKKKEERRKSMRGAARGKGGGRKKNRRPAMRAGDGDLVPKSRLELPTY